MEINPYQSPDALVEALPSEDGYYHLDTTRVSLAEYWRLANNPLVLVIAVICKFLRIRLNQHLGFSLTGGLLRLDAASITPEAADKMRPLVAQASELGLSEGFLYTLPTVGSVQVVGMALRSPDGSLQMGMAYVKSWQGQQVLAEKVSYAFVAKLPNGGYLVTSGSKPELDPPPQYDIEHLPKRPLAEVLARHRDRLAACGEAPQPIHDDDQLEQMVSEYEKQTIDFHIERGTYVPMSQDDVDRLFEASASAAPPANHPVLDTLGTIFGFMLGFGVVWGFIRDGNASQELFRMSLVGLGLVGWIAVTIIKQVRK